MRFKYIGSGESSPEKINFMGQVEFELNGSYVDVPNEIIQKLEGNKCFKAELKTIEAVVVTDEKPRKKPVKKKAVKKEVK